MSYTKKESNTSTSFTFKSPPHTCSVFGPKEWVLLKETQFAPPSYIRVNLNASFSAPVVFQLIWSNVFEYKCVSVTYYEYVLPYGYSIFAYCICLVKYEMSYPKFLITGWIATQYSITFLLMYNNNKWMEM